MLFLSFVSFLLSSKTNNATQKPHTTSTNQTLLPYLTFPFPITVSFLPYPPRLNFLSTYIPPPLLYSNLHLLFPLLCSAHHLHARLRVRSRRLPGVGHHAQRNPHLRNRGFIGLRSVELYILSSSNRLPSPSIELVSYFIPVPAAFDCLTCLQLLTNHLLFSI